jgi:hypothetical protein
MLGGVGIVLALILFFFWRKSGTSWKKTIAWIGLIWAGISFLFIVFVAMNS